MRPFCVLLAGSAVLAGTLLASAQTPDGKAPAAKNGPVYTLEQFGPVEKAADAEATFQKASKDIIASGGGILMIPAQAAAGWKPRNTTQEQWRKPAPPEPTKQWGSLKVDGPVTTTGLSGDTATPAKNLRGKNVGVKAGETKVTVAFPIPETDENYAVFIEQNWLTNRSIVNKAATGFTVEFDKAAPQDARLDWLLVR
jgi:hypothetical protein